MPRITDTFARRCGPPGRLRQRGHRARPILVEALEERALLATGNELARIRLETTDLVGTPISGVNVGQQFLVRAWVSDLRANPQGVFAAYLDVLYSSDKVSVAGPITFGSIYPNGRSGDTGTAGLINEVGAFDGGTPLGGGERLLFTVTMQANALGTATFDADPADNLPVNHVLLFGVGAGIPASDIDYVDTSIMIGAPATISVDDVVVVEGDSGTAPANFTIRLSNATGVPVTVNYATAPGTASPGSDYHTTSGSVTFAVGETTKTVSVPIVGDLIFEQVEGFLLNLSGAVGATIARGTAVGTIVDNDPVGAGTPPAITIDDVLVFEGDAGTAPANFTVRLSKSSSNPVTVNFATAPGTATPGSDYQSTSGTLTFAPGETTKTITVQIVGDLISEPIEGFTVNLSGAVGATIADGMAVGTIVDNDPAGSSPPTISIDDVLVFEGDAGTTPANFTVRLSKSSTSPVTVNFATAPGTATPGSDYQSTSGTLTFAPGETTKTITVQIVGDLISEPIEGFTVNLSGAVGATIADGMAVGTIVDNDPAGSSPPTISIDDVLVFEGDAGTTPANFTVRLSKASSGPVTVNYATAPGTATPGSDYQAASGTLTFAPGETTKTITVQVINDLVFEQIEGFLVNLSGALGATIADGTAVGTIVDNDPAGSSPPTISIDDVLVFEGDAGTTPANFTVRLSKASTAPVTVNYATAPGTATPGSDYQSTSGSLTFAPGETTKTITVQIVGDTVHEPVEGFVVNLSGAVGATIDDGMAVGTIIDNDTLRTLSISDVLVIEPSSGTKAAQFTVTLSSASASPVTVQYATADGTAKASDNDYVPVSGTLTIAAGQTTATITVQIVGDARVEGVEGFTMSLFNASGASIADGLGVATILDFGF